jgi:glycosyltransferase involved in cell wall biosynthesis
MKIGQLLPSIYASSTLFPDKIFAPRELAIDLVNGLVDRGHEVTTFSVPDLPVKGKLVSQPLEAIAHALPYYKFRDMEEARRHFIEEEFTKHRYELATTVEAFSWIRKGLFDLIHVYMDSSLFFAHYLEDLLSNVPVLYTLHDPLPPKGTFEYEEFTRFGKHNYISISNMFRHNDLSLHFIETIYHGIHVADYPYNEQSGDGYLFLGRLVPEKGLHNAIAAAIAAKVPLTVSVNLPGFKEVNVYYENTLKDALRSPFCNVLPVVDKARRIELYRNAKALLFPIEWEEPFGVVLIEAMACGTPVIAYNRGSVPEIIKDGITGYIIDPDGEDRPGFGTHVVKKTGIEGIIEAMGLISKIERSVCRRHVEEHFSRDVMVANYEKCYESILK